MQPPVALKFLRKLLPPLSIPSVVLPGYVKIPGIFGGGRGGRTASEPLLPTSSSKSVVKTGAVGGMVAGAKKKIWGMTKFFRFTSSSSRLESQAEQAGEGQRLVADGKKMGAVVEETEIVATPDTETRREWEV